MTWQHVYKLTKTKARGVRLLLGRPYHPKVAPFTAKFPSCNASEIAIQAETKAYQAIFVSDLACNWDRAASPETDQAKYNLKGNSW